MLTECRAVKIGAHGAAAGGMPDYALECLIFVQPACPCGRCCTCSAWPRKCMSQRRFPCASTPYLPPPPPPPPTRPPARRAPGGGQPRAPGPALITNPRVLMLDEPTSGLDSFTANEVGGAEPHGIPMPRSALRASLNLHYYTAAVFSELPRRSLMGPANRPPPHPTGRRQVVTLLKGLTSEGVTVVATIHSPTAYAFSLFDRWVGPRGAGGGGSGRWWSS